MTGISRLDPPARVEKRNVAGELGLSTARFACEDGDPPRMSYSPALSVPEALSWRWVG